MKDVRIPLVKAFFPILEVSRVCQVDHCAELPSSESSLTGISFSSSSDAVGVCDDPNTNVSRKLKELY